MSNFWGAVHIRQQNHLQRNISDGLFVSFQSIFATEAKYRK